MDRTLPLFPLEAILYPGTLMPLRIFQPRYVQLLEDLQRVPGSEFGVIGLRSGSSADLTVRPDTYDVGCTATVRMMRREEAGASDTFAVTVLGRERFRLLGLVDQGTPYVCGKVEPFEDEPADPATLDDVESLASENLVLFAKYVRGVADIRGRTTIPVTEANLPSDAPSLSWLMASAIKLSRAEQQKVLEIPSDALRLARQRRLLTRELALISRLGALPVGPGDLPSRSGQN
ncbi:hypothetical protein CLV47_12722 [Antricoccus suffuscus]|uniref:Lon N-terminal domain-containing protein n=1 Tax=Antricoccus suffuscus TaxID=1629062 RepID=A0A2T0Z5S3_9ACTN|nr:LON peptidase substrate-binding domain-containing protein [Antricoccus suffuscus]PRZ31686.1 hypothetical protein CLV47_12722 [Antricoccus suffuscus]